MNGLQLKIVSPEKILFQGNAGMVRLPGTEGEFSILSHHAPLISSLKEGDIIYETDAGVQEKVSISGGFVEVRKNMVTVCVE